MSFEPIFVKVELRVLFEEVTSADYYREVADSYEVDEDSDSDEEETSEVKQLREEKRLLLKRAEELDEEPAPSAEELYAFLSDTDMNKPRFAEMIDVCVLWHKVHNAQLYLNGDDVEISFVLETTDKLNSVEAVEETIGDDPFYKSKVGGYVGNYCKFPSRINPEDLLGELNVDARVTRVTDLSGNTNWNDDWEPVRDDSEERITHPYYMTHEELFGEPEPVETNLDEIAPKPKKWSKRFIPKMIRRLFKPTHSVQL